MFINHGLSGYYGAPHIEAFARAFLDNNFTVVRFDSRYSTPFNQSDGELKDCTIETYLEDLETVTEWASNQGWYREQFWLCGHSLGGITVLEYANKNREKVAGIAPISSVIDGNESWSVVERYAPEVKEKGYMIKESPKGSGYMKKLTLELYDFRGYSAYKYAPEIDIPLLLMVGSEDNGTTPESHHKLYDLYGVESKMLKIIEGAPHTFIEQEHLDAVYDGLDKWIKSLV